VIEYHSVDKYPQNKEMLKKSFFVSEHAFPFVRFSRLSDAALLSVSNQCHQHSFSHNVSLLATVL
jgi:hypothetical protein